MDLVLCMAPEPEDMTINRCLACGINYNAPNGNLTCPLCGSDLVEVSDDQDFNHYRVTEDARQAILKTYLSVA